MKSNKEKEPSFFNELGVYMKPYNTKYSISIILSIISVSLNILSFVFVSFILKELLMDDINFKNVLIYLILTIISKLGHALLLNTSTLISHKAAYLTLCDIRLSLTNKMLKLPLGYFEKNGTGRLKTMLVDHIENMEKTLAHMLPELTSNLLCPLALIVYMFIIDWRLALITLAWIIIGFSVTSGMMKNYNIKFEGQKKAHKEMNQAVVEMVNGIEVIKNFGRSDEIYNKYKDKIYNHASYNVNWQKETQVYSGLGMAIAPFSLFPVLIFGLLFFTKSSIDVTTLLMMSILTFAIFAPLMQSSTYFDELAGMGVNAKEIKDVLDYKELERGKETNAKSLDISFNDVSFSYDNNSSYALENINLTIKENEYVALVGPSGSGKSTIGKILAGFYDPTSGNITIGDKPLTEYSIDYLNKLISYVDQDTFLFDKSIKDNIILGNPNIKFEEIKKVAIEAGCDEFINKTPNGYDTLAGEMGNKLSGGEKQRIAILRAILKKAPIMILDEATASTDPENEASIQKALLTLAKTKTLIVIAHRLYTIKNADKIVFLKNGKIQAIGTHEELLHSSKDYLELWEKSEGEAND